MRLQHLEVPQNQEELKKKTSREYEPYGKDTGANQKELAKTINLVLDYTPPNKMNTHESKKYK